MDVADREQRFWHALESHNHDAMIVSSPTSIRWLTGFTGSYATVLATQGRLVLLTDSRYRDRAPDELAAVNSTATVVVPTALSDHVASTVQSDVVAVEADHVTWAEQQTMDDEWLPNVELSATVGLIAELRATKDEGEVARVERAAQHVDRALASVRPLLGEGPSELSFAHALAAAIRADGADDLGFDTIVASGPNGAIPHHNPGDRIIGRGDLVIVDVGAKVDGYRSDMTRTFCVGPMTADQHRHYDTVVAAQQAGVEAMVADSPTVHVHQAARGVIEAAGWGDAFTHGTGHGVGLDIHELPRVTSGVDDVYDVGTVATVEPGVYLRGVAGVRIEDTCVVAPHGAAERLTRFPKDNPEVL